MTEQEWLNNNQLSLDIWHKKYQVKGESFEQWLDRISGGNEDVRQLIKERKFLFGGRILASRRVKDKKATYSNCFVITPPEDNIESIFDTAYKIAKTYSRGGGCGIDVSGLRPNGSIVHNAARSTSGAVSFMDFYSYVTGLIAQKGRRGALMISISCTHPDIYEFINLKTKRGICEKANISIRVSDDFMKAVQEDRAWTTEFTSLETGTVTRIFGARDLMRLIARRNWEWAEPGVLFWDRITGYNMLDNNPDFKYAGVNPCAEEPLPAGGSCMLGSLNLSEFVLHPFSANACVDYLGLTDAVRTAVIALNDILEEGMERLPLEEQRKSVEEWRQIGLGSMGMADMLIKLGVTYGSDEAIVVVGNIYKLIAREAVRASLELAKSRGKYSRCDGTQIVKSSFIKALDLPEEILEDIRTYGLRNSQLLTCAPTGSIGTMLQTSTGVEPNFALHYTRKTQSLNGEDTFYTVSARIIQDYYNTVHDYEEGDDILPKLPDYFVESKDIRPVDRIRMQAELQKYTDAGISSTINLPKEATVDDVYDIYMKAWEHGLKGVTVYRQGCLREGILTVEKPDDIPVTGAPKRPETLPCDIYKVRVKGEDFIVCVGLYNYRPYEIFVFRPQRGVNLTGSKGQITKIRKGQYSLSSADFEITNLLNTRLTVEEKAATLYSSMLMRHGVSLKYIIKTARKVDDNIVSFSSAMCRVLSRYLPAETIEGKCPECGADLIHEGGCVHCQSCSYSRCE